MNRDEEVNRAISGYIAYIIPRLVKAIAQNNLEGDRNKVLGNLLKIINQAKEDFLQEDATLHKFRHPIVRGATNSTNFHTEDLGDVSERG